MFNTQQYLPFGLEVNFIEENKIEYCIKEKTPVSCRIIEYDIDTCTFTVSICHGVNGIIHNTFFESKNTAASFVGRVIDCIITSNITACGSYVCNIDPRFYEAQNAQYEEGTKLIAKIATLTAYGALVDMGCGKPGLLHLNEIRKVYGDHISNPSEKFCLDDIVEVYVHNDEGKVQFFLRKQEAQEKTSKTYNFISFLKSKIAS